MNRLLLFLLLIIVILNRPLSAQKPGDNVFAGVQVHTVYLQFNQANYWDSLLYYYNLGTEQYIMASATLDGVVLDSIGVRLKGNASFAHPNNKKPFKLDFAEYNSAQRWDGLKSVHINNCWGDPTFMREKLHLDFCRDAGIPAPRGNFAVVYLNNVLWGLYSLEESVDKRFLTNHYANTSGNLYKAVDAVGTSSTLVSDFLWYGTDTTQYTQRYELKTDNPVNPWADLMQAIDTLNNGAARLNTFPVIADVTSVIRAFAVDNILANLDSYIGSGRNFYFYNQGISPAFTWIVWDASLSFGAYPNTPASAEQMSLTYTSAAAARPLAAFIFNNTQFKNQYYREVCRITNRFLNSAVLFNKIDSVASVIRPYVYADSKKMYTNLQFETNLSSDFTPAGGKRIPGLKSFINLRYNNILSQLGTAGISCASSVVAGEVVINEFMASNDTIPDPSGEFEDWIELYNRTGSSVNLSGCYLTDDANALTKWAFPEGTVIAPFGYLVVWADQDSGQPGLHASFKLSSGGEKLILSNAEVAVLDSFSYGAQQNNLSMSRLPDGTGAFVISRATPGASNLPLSADESAIPDKFTVSQNYPNPFNPSTVITYQLPAQAEVSISVYSSLGEEVFSEKNILRQAGTHTFVWNAKNNKGHFLPGGIYLYRITANHTSFIKKMVFLK